MSTTQFLHRDVPALGRRAFRLGLASNYGIDARGVRAAFDRGVDYVFYTFRSGALRDALREVLPRERERFVVSAVPYFAYAGGNVRRGAERILKALGTDYLDVFHLPWLGTLSAWTAGTVRELEHLKSSGKVRAIGVSIHDRPRAGRLAEDSPLDLLMIRYNAAHPGAEREIFPHLAARRPAVVAYTATSHGELMKRPRGWTGEIPTAGDCYRYCLSSPHVDVVLCAPKSSREFDENVAALERGPMTEQELGWMRDFGRAVHG